MAPHDVLVVIPARGGSKSIPRKNLADLGGKPLLVWTIEAALAAEAVTGVLVSSDDAEVRAVAVDAGADARDQPDASDTSVSHQALAYALGTIVAPDVVVLAHPTSPFRTAEDFDACIRLVLNGASSVMSVSEPDRHPWLYVTIQPDGRIERYASAPRNLPPRQFMPRVHVENGAIYAARFDYWRAHRGFWGPRTSAYVMPRERSIDIDTPLDLTIARALLAAQAPAPTWPSGLSPRALGAFHKAGISPGDAAVMSDDDLLALYGVGRATVDLLKGRTAITNDTAAA